MKIAIIGCGLMGQKRAAAVQGCQVIVCVDSQLEKATQLASQFPGCIALTDWSDVMQRDDVQLVIIATPHAWLAEIGLAAVAAGKHVLMEKPGGRHSNELAEIGTIAHQTGALVRLGFNHRYHRALQKARELVDQDAIGDLMFIRARYGHGGRVGYEKEWRANPVVSGGGELIDQGVHLIDLARWFLGDFNDVQGLAQTFFWDMPVDDNGFLLLKTPKKQVAFLHASCTEWKNLFSFEIYGRTGKIDISGLGGSYGIERLVYYKMSAAMGPPEALSWEYPTPDTSWEVEFAEFLEDIRLQRQPAAGIADAEAALRIVEEIYRMSEA